MTDMAEIDFFETLDIKFNTQWKQFFANKRGNMRIEITLRLSMEVRSDDKNTKPTIVENMRTHAQELYALGTMCSRRPVEIELESEDDDEGTIKYTIFTQESNDA